MTLTEIEKRLLCLIDAVGEALPFEQLDEMRSLAKAGEPGVSLENLCVQLFEYEAPVERLALAEIALLGKEMGLRPEIWERLSRKT